MRRFAPALAAGAVLFAAAPVSSAAPPASAGLCDDIAARLRADPAFTKAGLELQPLDALAKQGFAEIATASDEDSDSKESGSYVQTLVAKYGMDAGLAAAVKDITFESDQVWSLKANPVHAFSDMGGTAHCAAFVFFQDGHRLPDAPAALYGGMSEDSEGPIVECYRSEGNLARIGGKTVFAATDRHAPRNFDVDLRLAAFENGQWGAACAVRARFETLYRVTKIFRAKDAPLTEAAIAKLAPAIARARDEAGAAKKAFAFGPKPGPADKARLMTLAGTLPVREDTIPAFGAKLEPDTDNNVGNDRDDLPVVIGGKPYLVRIGHPSVGWRDFPGYTLVFYRDDGKTLAPVASVLLDENSGRMTGIEAEALKP
ncbi:MAG: hypothetical protein JOZ72_02510 [Alphaproteobacteria bacterium]|nr:hypothetical protein [Alphaproteobacteria bacterium]